MEKMTEHSSIDTVRTNLENIQSVAGFLQMQQVCEILKKIINHYMNLVKTGKAYLFKNKQLEFVILALANIPIQIDYAQG